MSLCSPMTKIGTLIYLVAQPYEQLYRITVIWLQIFCHSRHKYDKSASLELTVWRWLSFQFVFTMNGLMTRSIVIREKLLLSRFLRLNQSNTFLSKIFCLLPSLWSSLCTINTSIDQLYTSLGLKPTNKHTDMYIYTHTTHTLHSLGAENSLADWWYWCIHWAEGRERERHLETEREGIHVPTDEGCVPQLHRSGATWQSSSE